MGYVVGYQHQGPTVVVVLITLIVLQLKGLLHNNANYGANLVFQMVYHAYKYQLAHPTQHNKHVQTKGLMEFACGN